MREGPPTLQEVITTHHPGSLIKVAQMARHWANDTGVRSWPPREGGGWVDHLRPLMLPEHQVSDTHTLGEGDYGSCAS